MNAASRLGDKLADLALEAEIPRNLKYVTAGVSLLALGATFEQACRLVPEMRREVAEWEDGRRTGVGVMPEGPYITLLKEGDGLKCLGLGLKDPDITILFKNLDSAILIFTGFLGAPAAVAENRICVHGDNSKAMQMTRAMAIAQTYLFPGIILDKTFKRPPKLSLHELVTKGKIMGMLAPTLARIMLRPQG